MTQSAEQGGIFFSLMIESLHFSLTIVILHSFLISRCWGPTIGAVVLSGVRRIACLNRGIGDLVGRIWVVGGARLWGRGPAMADGIEHFISIRRRKK